MIKAYKYRLKPNREQERALRRECGTVRYVYNWALEKKIEAYSTEKKNLSEFDLIKMVTTLKRTEGLEWIAETAGNQSLCNAMRNLNSAYAKFFKEKKGFPKFKKKGKNRDSITFLRSFHIDADANEGNRKGKIKVPRLGWLNAHIDRTPSTDSELKMMTVSYDPSGKWFASVVFDDLKTAPEKKGLPTMENTVGIDLGIKDFAVLSTGEKVPNPRIGKNLSKRLAILQKRHARKQKGSSNREKSRVKAARCHEKIKNKRTDFLHKVANGMLGTPGVENIALETLSVKNMMKNRKLAFHIGDVSWFEFVRILSYKAEWLGIRILRCSRWAATSKTCTCGAKNHGLTLAMREWTCEVCGAHHDRDVLASCNIKTFSIADFYRLLEESMDMGRKAGGPPEKGKGKKKAGAYAPA